MNLKQLDASAYTGFRKSMIKKKGSERQRAFLASARLNSEFLRFVRDEVPTTEGVEIPVYEMTLTESEYKEPPADTENALHQAWSVLTPRFACSAALWGEVTLRHIEANCIQASYLAANGGTPIGGLDRIDRALSDGDPKGIDDCVRTILRKLSGLPEARGNRSPYVDCPFGRAWWRDRIAEEVCSSTGESRENIVDILRLSQAYWEEIINMLVSRNSIVGYQVVRDTLVKILSEQNANNNKSPILASKKLNALCRNLGVRSAWQELASLKMNDLASLIRGEIDAHFSS